MLTTVEYRFAVSLQGQAGDVSISEDGSSALPVGCAALVFHDGTGPQFEVAYHKAFMAWKDSLLRRQFNLQMNEQITRKCNLDHIVDSATSEWLASGPGTLPDHEREHPAYFG